MNITKFYGTRLGFAKLPDPKNEKVLEQSLEAEDQAIECFRTRFKKTGVAL